MKKKTRNSQPHKGARPIDKSRIETSLPLTIRVHEEITVQDGVTATITGKARIVANSQAAGQLNSASRLQEPLKRRQKGARMSVALAANTLQKPLYEQTNLFEKINGDQKMVQAIQEKNIQQLGATLSATGWRSLIAVSRLVQKHNVYDTTDRHLRETGEIANKAIVITQKEYLDAYGVKRVINSKGSLDYASSEAAEALRALTSELSKPIFQTYSRGATSGKKGRRDVVRAVEPLVTTRELYLDVTTQREREISEGDTSGRGLKHLRIMPSDIFFSLGFMYLPEALYSKLEEAYSGKELSPALYNLAMILVLEAHRNNPQLVRDLKKLGYNVGHGKLIESRQLKRLRKVLEATHEKLRDVGAVTGDLRFSKDLTGEKAVIDIVVEAFGYKELSDGEPNHLTLPEGE